MLLVGFSDKTEYQYFFRTIQTPVEVADVMLSFATKQGWSKVGLIYTDDTLGQQCNEAYALLNLLFLLFFFIVYQRTLIQASQMNMHISQYQVITASSTATDISNALRNISSGSTRIIMVAATGTTQTQLMIQAYELGLVNKDYVWLMMNDASTNLQAAVDGYNTNHTSQIDYTTAYNGLFLFQDWLSLNGYPYFESFLDRWAALDPNV